MDRMFLQKPISPEWEEDSYEAGFKKHRWYHINKDVLRATLRRGYRWLSYSLHAMIELLFETTFSYPDDFTRSSLLTTEIASRKSDTAMKTLTKTLDRNGFWESCMPDWYP